MIRKKFHKILVIDGEAFKLRYFPGYNICSACRLVDVCETGRTGYDNLCEKFNIDQSHNFVYDKKKIS